MKRLIYYVCYGSQQQPLLEASIQSLRLLGKFDGEIIVFSDQKIIIPGCDHLELVQHVETFEEMAIGRVDFGLTVSGDYSEIAYFDNDIIAVKPIDDFFLESDYFRAQPVDRSMFGNRFNWPVDGNELSLALKLNYICDGTFMGIPGVFRESLKVWREIYNESRQLNADFGIYRDENTLNMAILRNRIKFKPFPIGFIPLPHERTGKEMFVHYGGYLNKFKMLPDWQQIKTNAPVSESGRRA